MFESLIGLIVLVGLIVVVVRQNSRIGLIERELGALRSFVLSSSPPATAAHAAAVVEPNGTAADSAAASETAEPAVAQASAVADDAISGATLANAAETEQAPPEAGPWSGPAEQPAEVAAAAPRKPDIETALGTRWAVWVGGIALALGGVFLIRYSIEAGIFGPEVRLAMAALLGLLLAGGGEFIRRTGFKVPVEGMQNAYVPAILTAAGAFTLFGTVYAAHGIYGFIGPAAGFTLMALIGLATIAAALVHGQALGGVGLVGSYATPILVSSTSPNAWALFGFLAIVLVAAGVIARLRDWKPLMAAAFFGPGAWAMLYLVDSIEPDFIVLLFIHAVTLGTLALVWLRGRADAPAFDLPSVVPALFVGMTAAALAIEFDPAAGGMLHATILIVAMVVVAGWRKPAIAVLFGAGIAASLIYLRLGFSGSFAMEFSGGDLTVEGFDVVPATAGAVLYGLVIGIVFLAAGLWSARRFAATDGWRASVWAAWSVAVPLIVLFSTWIAFGNLDVDLRYATAALLLALLASVGGELVARAEDPPMRGGEAVSFLLAGAGLALVMAIHMAFGGGMTTILVGTAALLPAFATRFRSYPVLGWLCAGAAVVVLGRVAVDPTIVGAARLSTTPVFNQLLAGYGLPALAFGIAAWQLARTTGGRPRHVMEAAAVLFALLTAAMLVRHAMNGGVISADVPTLAEQAIYTLITIGGGAILIALDARAPSPVFRFGSMVIGILSVAFIALSHLAALNPLYTNESTGRIPVANLLLLAYLLPGLAMAALAWYARPKRPRWYVAMLALVAAVLGFVYATLSVRRLFQGEFIGLWKGFSQLETYSYSALWLALGVALLIGGVMLKSQVLRIASAGLVVIAVAKVFLFDMSELEGVLRAFSFIGLGAVLIGIGLFYQRMLTRAALKERAREA